MGGENKIYEIYEVGTWISGIVGMQVVGIMARIKGVGMRNEGDKGEESKLDIV